MDQPDAVAKENVASFMRSHSLRTWALDNYRPRPAAPEGPARAAHRRAQKKTGVAGKTACTTAASSISRLATAAAVGERGLTGRLAVCQPNGHLCFPFLGIGLSGGVDQVRLVTRAERVAVR